MLTLGLEREVICQVSALVISAQQEQGVGVPDLERPEVKDALKGRDGETLQEL